MDKKSKVVVAIIAVVVVVLAGAAAYFALGLTQQTQPQTDNSQQTSQQPSDKKSADDEQNTSVTYEGKTGKTALELLKSNNIVETKVYSGIGEMVVSIDDVKPKDSSEFWAFYVDGKQAQVGADQYVTKDGEKIEWKLETVQ